MVGMFAGIFSKLPALAKGLLFKLFIFLFGIFCGIGIVYKSGLPLPQEPAVVAPATNVTAYQKRIEELQAENAELRKALEVSPTQPQPTQPQPPRPTYPNAQPAYPNAQPTNPGSKTGVVIPGR